MTTPPPTSFAATVRTYERRRFPRFSARLDVHFHCLKSKENFRLHESVTRDVGAGGLAMTSAHSMRKGQLIMLTLFIPPDDCQPKSNSSVQEQCQRIFLLSRVAWENSVPQTGYVQGIEFVDIAEDDRRKLHRYLEACRPA